MDGSGNCAGETEIWVSITLVKWLLEYFRVLYHDLSCVHTIEGIVRAHEVYFRGLVLNLMIVLDGFHKLGCCDNERGMMLLDNLWSENSTVDGFCIWSFIISADKNVLPRIQSGLQSNSYLHFQIGPKTGDLRASTWWVDLAFQLGQDSHIVKCN
jgi:hypothetical protein